MAVGPFLFAKFTWVPLQRRSEPYMSHFTLRLTYRFTAVTVPEQAQCSDFSRIT